MSISSLLITCVLIINLLSPLITFLVRFLPLSLFHDCGASVTVLLISVLLVTMLWIISLIMSLLAAHSVLLHGCILDVISPQQFLVFQANIDLYAAHMLTIIVWNN